MIKHVALTWLALGIMSAHAGDDKWFGREEGPVSRAHRAYLEEKPADLLQSAKEALMARQDDDEAIANITDLMTKAQRNGAEFDPGWHMPKEFKRTRITQGVIQRPEFQRIRYRLRFSTVVPRKGMVTQLQVARYPNDIVIDSKAGLGDYEENPDGGEINIYAATDTQAQPFKAGLYLLNIDLTDGRQVRGWFVVDGRVPNTAPTVLTPTPNQVLPTGNPKLVWKNYVSPQYEPHEHRSLSVRIEDTHDQTVWEDYGLSHNATSVIVGPNQDSKLQKLEPGSYSLLLIYRETANFGDIRVGRDIRTILPFSVK